MDPRLDTFDWEEVFKYAEPHICEANHLHGPRKTIEASVSTDPFTRDDVVEVIAMVDGVPDGEPWVGVFRLRDGRYTCIRADCDYTGWGCRETGSSEVSDTREGIIRFGLGDDERRRLGLKLIDKDD